MLNNLRLEIIPVTCEKCCLVFYRLENFVGFLTHNALFLRELADLRIICKFHYSHFCAFVEEKTKSPTIRAGDLTNHLNKKFLTELTSSRSN
jgi:hypothetical protein